MPHGLKIRLETPIGFDVGVADQMTGLRFFTAHGAFFGHDILRIFGRLPEKIRFGTVSGHRKKVI